jgi:NAD(P)-dependent dehydrogenase (short-subunit alcohol dehydrogenase family)
MRSEHLSKQGKRAVVTGAAEGIGRDYALRLATDGADIIIIDQLDASETKAAVEKLGRSCHAFECDLTDPEQIEATVQAILAACGHVDILVNNAGGGSVIAFEDIDHERFRRTLALNAEAPFVLCKAFVPGMKQAGGGRIVNITSSMVNQAVPNFVDYVTSKGAVMGLTRALASEVGPFNITVNAIAPGLVRTPLTTQGRTGHAPMAQAGFEMVAQMQSIKSSMVPNDLVGTMSFLTSDDAAFITGQIIHVDGGVVFV